MLAVFLPCYILLNRSNTELNQKNIELKQLAEELTKQNSDYEQLQNRLQELELNHTNGQNIHEELLEKEAEIQELNLQLESLHQSLSETKLELTRLTEKKETPIVHEKIEAPISLKNEKKVFLTFDDGPTSLTPTILNILEDHEVKATFFTIGNRMEQYPDVVQQAYDEGHMVLPHSYSHDYAIYTSFDTFYEDFFKAEEVYTSILGLQPPTIFRFPGGSSNHSSFQYGGEQFMPKLTEDIRQRGYYYIDWNVTSGDAGPDAGDADRLLDNVIQQSKRQDFVVVLFHDTAPNTATAKVLPDVIQHFKKQGFTFRTFRDIADDELQLMVSKKIANKTISR
ncbi:MAG: polysaccharide deacetylase family protein [Bacillaceae bacterium]|nr:polysaccharide deacetylase family protein [Bacillaceae bacterium]